MTDRFHMHAKAIWAFYKAGILHSKYLKETVKKIIVQSSETTHWHYSAHYRSLGAAEKIIAAIDIGVIHSVNSYHEFCNASANEMRHEHMVPTRVVYGLILAHLTPSLDAYENILRRCGYRATILKTEDKRLNQASVPDLAAFTWLGGEGYFDHHCRYKAPKDGGSSIKLVNRPVDGWAVLNPAFRRKQPRLRVSHYSGSDLHEAPGA